MWFYKKKDFTKCTQYTHKYLESIILKYINTIIHDVDMLNGENGNRY